MRFAVYQESLIGGRPSNQDRMGYCFSRDALLLLLADGMGGHLHGEIAASLSLQTAGALFRERAVPTVADPQALLDELVFAAHQSLLGYRATHRLPDTPRTTIVACLVQQGMAWWAHCGDSRLYWLRRGRILARTVDHSHLERLVALGKVSPAERANHPDRNKLYNCLGSPTLPRVDKAPPVQLQSGDQLLLCSDGLWSGVREHEMAYRLSAGPLDDAIPALVRQADVANGKNGDNVTALAVTWLDDLRDPGQDLLMTDGLPRNQVITSIHPVQRS
ncbi:MAG: serine/threonine-protein phosphatase [Burkholderiaceae bacterium]|nr:serine/threonine-protein phosphatase [Burkholderiaceae bacterium]